MAFTEEKPLTLDEALKVHEAFRPLLLSGMLKNTLDQITKHKKDRDDAQKARLQTAVKILSVKDVDLPAYPDKTYESLVAQMNKQLEKIEKKQAKK